MIPFPVKATFKQDPPLVPCERSVLALEAHDMASWRRCNKPSVARVDGICVCERHA